MGSVLLFATLPLLILAVVGSVMLRLYPRSVPTGWVPRFRWQREIRVPMVMAEATGTWRWESPHGRFEWDPATRTGVLVAPGPPFRRNAAAFIAHLSGPPRPRERSAPYRGAASEQLELRARVLMDVFRLLPLLFVAGSSWVGLAIRPSFGLAVGAGIGSLLFVGALFTSAVLKRAEIEEALEWAGDTLAEAYEQPRGAAA